MSPRQPKVGDRVLFTGDSSGTGRPQAWEDRKTTPGLVIAVCASGGVRELVGADPTDVYVLELHDGVGPLDRWYCCAPESLKVIGVASWSPVDPEDRSTWPIAIDPIYCGCTECGTGQYVPLNQATAEQIAAMRAGILGDHLHEGELDRFLTGGAS